MDADPARLRPRLSLGASGPRSIRPVALAGVAAALAALATFAVSDELAPERAAEQHAIGLIVALRDGDPDRRAAARSELHELGLPDDQIDRAARLAHPDPTVRAALARSLGAFDGRMRTLLFLRLTEDPDAGVRTAALESGGQLVPSAEVRQRVRQMAEQERNPVVRGYAQLLAAEWESLALPEVAETVFGEVAARRGGALSLGPLQGLTDETVSGVRQTPSPQPLGPTEAQPLLDELFSSISPYWREPPAYDGVLRVAADDPVRGSDFPAPPAPSRADDLERPFPSDPSAADDFFKINPDVLGRPIEPPFDREPPPDFVDEFGPLLTTERFPTLGFAGPSGVLPTEIQENSHFVPVEDRWRLGFPPWDRYGRGYPPLDDYPYAQGYRWNPYRQNVVKGDYPVIGQHTFFNILASSITINEFRQVPTATTPFESTRDPGQFEFFGDPDQYFLTSSLFLQMNLFHGNAAFKPFDWLVRVTPAFNVNYLDVDELGIVSPDVREGTTRLRGDATLQEYFLEAKLADTSPYYDFMSLRAGSQPFNSDFRGLVFFDVNRGVRLFGTRFANRDQFNVIYFDQVEKETNSLLNTFEDRHQNTLIANYYRQDFVYPGYTAQLSFHYNRDGPSFELDRNNFLVRPDPVGVFQPHEVEAFYFGVAGDGHIERINVTNAFYWVVGHDSLNPLAGRPQRIDAQLGAVELSYDRDWIRFRTAYLYASGDDDILDGEAEGFDTIFDNPFFAGNVFSYWVRQSVNLFRVNVTQRDSIVPNLRSSKFQGQSNFVNPGLHLYNLGMDFEVTPKLKLVSNMNLLFFDETDVLKTFVFQDRIDREIGTDIGGGFEYRPLLSDNVILVGGAAALFPGAGFDDLFGEAEQFCAGDCHEKNIDASALYTVFLDLVLNY